MSWPSLDAIPMEHSAFCYAYSDKLHFRCTEFYYSVYQPSPPTSSRVIHHKKGGSSYRIPFEIDLVYDDPVVDTVAPKYRISLASEDSSGWEQIRTVEEALEVYMTAYRAQRTALGSQRREQNLRRFLSYLEAQGHSMQVCDLRYEDGQEFLNVFVNAYSAQPVSPSKKKRYRSALRSFSRFLVQYEIIEQNVFFDLNT